MHTALLGFNTQALFDTLMDEPGRNFGVGGGGGGGGGWSVGGFNSQLSKVPFESLSPLSGETRVTSHGNEQETDVVRNS